MKIVGITGTNGKTTTIEMISRILEGSGKKIAMISTIKFKIGDEERINKTKYTTLASWHVQKFLQKAVREKCEVCILEVSSHSLDQNRLWGILFDIVAVTNITREHLDYHLSMDRYRQTKKTLFAKLKETGTAIINLDMKRPEDFLKVPASRIFGYTTSKNKRNAYSSDNIHVVYADILKTSISGSHFKINGEQIALHLPGKFNIENALAGICIGKVFNIPVDSIKRSLGAVVLVPGRMERVNNDLGIDLIIDYALTPDSLKKVGKLMEEFKKGDPSRKLIWVFGSCGERDKGKRPIMGGIVASVSDIVIVTNEDPYHEDPKQIIDQIFSGVIRKYKKENKNAFRVLDRKKAIKKALTMAQKGDIVLITGKGAEETMALGDQRVPWSDKKVIKEVLVEIGG